MSREKVAKPQFYGIKLGILLPIALSCISRGLNLLPIAQIVEKVPYIFTSFPTAPFVFSGLWIVAGTLLFISAFIGHRVTVYKGQVARLQLDDIAILLTIGVIAAWGLSYYIGWIESLIYPPRNGDYAAGRAYLPWAISGTYAWYLYFKLRTRKELQ